jgi:hypothetical protein
MQREDLNSNQADAPPKHVSPEEFLKRFRTGLDDAHFIVLRGVPIPVRILTVDECNSIRRDSAMNAAKISGDEVDKNIAVMKLTLQKATQTNPKHPAYLHEKLLGALTIDELEYIYNEYLKVLSLFNPSLSDISEEQFRGLVEVAKKKMLAWKDLSLPQLKAIFLDWAALMSRSAASPTPADSSSGGPSSELQP